MRSTDTSGRDPLLLVYSKMEMAKGKDSLERDWQYAVKPASCFPWHQLLTPLLQRSDECAHTITINFVLLQSPLLSPHDPETIIVSREYRSIDDFDNHLIIPQRKLLPLRHFQRFFGTSAVTGTVRTLLSNKILTSI